MLNLPYNLEKKKKQGNQSLIKWNERVILNQNPRKILVSLFNSHACPDGLICVGGDGIVNKRSRVQSQSGLLLKHLSNNLNK
jgi:hypothetical protein